MHNQDSLPIAADNTGWPWESSPLNLDAAGGPKISIITPSFNQGQYLEETIRSIVLQNYSNYELIIIDGGSTDNTLDIISKYERWITYWISEKDKGQSHAINKGLEKVTGEIVNWINSDDVVAPGAFYQIAQEFNLDKYDVICGKCDYFIGDLTNLDSRNWQMGIGETVGDTILKHRINQPSTFFKASVIKAIGIDERFRYTMDVDLWYRYLVLSGQTRVLLSDGLFSYFRLHESSKSVAESSGFNGEVWMVHYNLLYSMNQPDALLKYAARLVPDFDKFTPVYYNIKIPYNELNAFVGNLAWEALVYYNINKQYASARQCLKAAYLSGKTFDKTMLFQIFKLYIIPTNILNSIK